MRAEQLAKKNSSRPFCRLEGRVALITGSSRGIGRAIAIAFARAGADIGVTYKQDHYMAEQTVEQIRALGHRAIVAELDVSRRESVRRVVDVVRTTFGRVDILVNNAGILQQKPFFSISDEDWDRMLAVNLKGPFICAQEVMLLMKKQGGGTIINIASSGGQLGGSLAVHYSASKAGVIGLTKSLARVGAPDGIRVNCIAPGLIDTEMTQEEIHSEAGHEKIGQILLHRPGTVDEIAHVALFLASEEAAYITGQTVSVNGGLYLG